MKDLPISSSIIEIYLPEFAVIVALPLKAGLLKDFKL